MVKKKKSATAGDIRDTGYTPGVGRSPGGGRGNPLQYFFLENPMDRGAWGATVPRFAKSQTQLEPLGTHARTLEYQKARSMLLQGLGNPDKCWEALD